MTEWREVPLRIVDRIGDFTIYAVSRFAIVTPLAVANGVECIATNIAKLARMFANSYQKILIVYDALPFGAIQSNTIEAVVRPAITEILPITDIIDAIEGKQLMIIGNMGSGKSTVAQFLAYTVGGRVTVYEPEGTPEDWAGLEVIGKGEDFQAIDNAMAYDLEDLSSQIKLRTAKGDAALVGTERALIAEEFPELVNKCSNASEWIDRHGRRGRKAKRFLILLSQFDRVSAWGLEGRGDLVDNFLKLRLGKVAVSHAMKLKRDDLVMWLRADKGRGLLDDEPVQLPPYREMKAVTMRLPVTSQETAVTTVEPASNEFSEGADFALWRAISAHLDAGRGESFIIKEILGYQGSSYQKGKEVFAALKEKFQAVL
jgi:energy-coupling factor transporter ATP-binding protein EcfA2